MTHLLHTLRYCPRCGAPDLQHPHGRALHCPQCELTYFHNVAAAVACIVLDDHGQILSVRRAREPAKGALDLPGGFVDPGETTEAAAPRELYEETGLVPHSLRYHFSLPNTYPYSGIDVFTADLFYLARVANFNDARAADDAAALDIRPLAALRAEDYGLASIRAAVATIIREPALLQQS